jgi:hypothetical protein
MPTAGRSLAWLAAACSIALGCVAAFVGALDTQQTCVLVFDEVCDGPDWGHAWVAFGIAALLLTVGIALILRLRRPTAGAAADGDDR